MDIGCQLTETLMVMTAKHFIGGAFWDVGGLLEIGMLYPVGS
jgi:hypothetical protein